MVYYVVFLQLPLLLVIPVVVTVVRIAVVFVLPFVFVAVVAPWSEYQRTGLKIMLMPNAQFGQEIVTMFSNDECEEAESCEVSNLLHGEMILAFVLRNDKNNTCNSGMFTWNLSTKSMTFCISHPGP